MKRSSSRAHCAAAVLSLALFACGGGQQQAVALPATSGFVAAPSASASASAQSDAPLDLAAVAPLAFERGQCSLSVEPATAYHVAADLPGVAEHLNRDGFGAQLPEGDAALSERVCLADACEGDVAPLALSLGDEAAPAAFRVGLLVRRGTELRVYGPFDGGFQLYHCVPALSGEVHASAFDGELLGAALEFVQPQAVGVGENGPCEPELEPNCQRACFDEQRTRLDLFAQRSNGHTLLVTQTLRVADTALDVQPAPVNAPLFDAASRELRFEVCGERVNVRLTR